MYAVYILSNKWRTVLYTGVTNNLEGRLSDHRYGRFDGFTKRYNCTELVYYENHTTGSAASIREKQIKGWKRARKIALISSFNPSWEDLSPTIMR